MTREEAKEIFLNRGYVEVDGGTIYDANKWRQSCSVISEWLIEQEPREGHWIEKYHEMFKYYCDKCGDGSDLNTQFCPKCGARMAESEK